MTDHNQVVESNGLAAAFVRRVTVMKNKKDKIRHSLFALALTVCSCAYAGPKPAHTNLRYNPKYAQSTLDVWLPPSTNTSCPMVVFFHGGGFVGGDKSQFSKNPLLSKCLKNGIACASVNYPFKKDADYLEIMAQSAESIELIKTQAEDWNIDPDRIAVMGTSAGAMIAEYLSYWCDMGITACFADQQPKYSWFLVTPIKKGAPALILYTRSGTRNELHHPKHAKFFKRHCDSVGVTCELYGTKASGLPELPTGLAIEDRVMKFFAEQWKQHSPKNSPVKNNRSDAADGR